MREMMVDFEWVFICLYFYIFMVIKSVIIKYVSTYRNKFDTDGSMLTSFIKEIKDQGE